MPKIVVTGGLGFIGSALVKSLSSSKQNQNEVLIIDDYSSYRLPNLDTHSNLDGGTIVTQKVERKKPGIIRLDIGRTSPEEIARYLEGADTIYHLAAKARVEPSFSNTLGYYETNVTGTLNMLEAARIAKVKRFIFTSSSAVYGDQLHLPTHETAPLRPLSPYALQKVMAEQLCEYYGNHEGMKVTVLRLFNVYGEGMSRDSGEYRLVMAIFAEQLLMGEPLTITGDGEQRRDFVHITDVVGALRKVGRVKPDSGYCVFNIGSGVNYSVNQIAKLMNGNTFKAFYVAERLEPRETLADISLIRLCYFWQPKVNLDSWLPRWFSKVKIAYRSLGKTRGG